MKILFSGLVLPLLSGAIAFAADTLTSGDAFARFDRAATTWTIGTGVIEQRLELASGKFHLASLRNRATRTDFVQAAGSDEFRFVFGGDLYSGESGDYRLKGFEITRLAIPKASPGIEPGVALDIDLEHPRFLLRLHYEAFASTPRTPLGIVRKWYRITNRTAETQPLTEISMNHLRVPNDLGPKLTLYWWRGGGADQDTNNLHADPLEKQRNRVFHSVVGSPGYRVDDIYDGSASYHPYFVLEDTKAGEGLFLGFNYLGPWSTRILNAGEYTGRPGFLVASQLELHTEPLGPNKTFESPNSFVGVYQGDLDSAGEQLQDWQSTYKWDYTRDEYLWSNGFYNGHWNDPAHKQRIDLHTKEMWRIAELSRRVGCDVAHEDDFWFDERGRGVWEGIDWKEMVSYLRESGIHFRLWMPPQHFAPGTPPDAQHPDWAPVPKAPDGITGWYGLGFCVAAQGAHDYMRNFMLEREKRYGAFFYRLDGWVQTPCWAKNHDHPAGQPHVQQYRHFLDMMREVKVGNPKMGLQGCNSGGEWANWDKMELLENNQPSDGGGPDDDYYLTYFWPVSKLIQWGVASDEPNSRQLDEMRDDILVRRFLRNERVLDRYTRVYHPRAEGAPDAHTYMQLTNGDRTKAVFFQDGVPKGEVVLYPKRLAPDAKYSVAFRFAKDTRTATGAELMRDGIRFRSTDKREMVLLNLDAAPGRGTDRTPPSPASAATKRIETWHEQKGVALRWTAATDNVLVGAYEVLRDGKRVDAVGIGTFYFDASEGAGLDQTYEIVAIDGDGNRSPAIKAAR